MKASVKNSAFIASAILAWIGAAGTSSAASPQPPPVESDGTTACAIQRLLPFVGPYGIRQAWPVADALPAKHEHALGVLLSDTGHVADGYQQFLHVDADAREVYVVQQGGFAGMRKVYGPLPLPRCDAAPTQAPPR